MKARTRLKTVMALILIMSGCDRAVPVAPMVVPKAQATTKTFPIKGVVKGVDSATTEVRIAHEKIDGFMDPMTMPFSLRNPSLLQGVKVGDEVEGTLQVNYEGSDLKELFLTSLKVIGHESKPPEAIATMVTAMPDVLRPGETVPDFMMTTQDGNTLKLADLRGKVVVLSFIYTRCPSPEYCPAMDGKFADLARRIAANAERADQVRLLSVSFDPEHDTPEVLKAHAGRRGAKPPLWTFAVASHEELSKIAGPLGLTYVPGTREIDHNLRAAVIGPDGRLAVVEVGKDWTSAEVFKSVLGLIPDGGK